MTNKLMLLALVGAPFLCIGVYVEAYYPPLGNSWWTGLWGLLYITGWMASLELIRRHKLAGTLRFGQTMVWLVLGTLAVANGSNGWQLVAPAYKPALFWVLDMSWPISNVLMLPLGWAVAQAKQLPGWRRWVPLAVGLWLPLSMATSQTSFALHVSNLYSVLAWLLLAIVMGQEATRQQAKGLMSIHAANDAVQV